MTQENPQAEIQRMLAQVKTKLKPESKNELIRIISALLLDNYTLKLQLHEAIKAQNPAQTEVSNEV